jgi:hypothetical protein
MISLKKKFTLLAVGIVLILFIPLAAMQFTSEVNWDLPDFIVAGILLFGIGGLILFISKYVKTKTYKIALLLAVIIAFFLLWAEMAVGLFGSIIAGS